MRVKSTGVIDVATAAQRRKASQVLNAAVQAGRITKPADCAWCGVAAKRLEGHHPDYARPLMVVWLCVRCHRAHHKRFRIPYRYKGKPNS